MNNECRHDGLGSTNACERQVDIPGIPGPPTVPYQIYIDKVWNGFILRMGCKTLVFESQAQMIKELDRYYTNPVAVTEEYFKKLN